MKKTVLLCAMLLFLLTAEYAKAQPYQSLLGQNSTAWIFRWSNLPGHMRDSAWHATDTLVGTTSYHKVRTRFVTWYEGALYREDTLSGKVWYRECAVNNDPSDTVERLLFDYALMPGDTFDISGNWYPAGSLTTAQKTVDSVRVINGRKHIYFGAPSLFADEPYTFIEGIGSNAGILAGTKGTVMFRMYLLCTFKDGIKTGYTNRNHNGDCSPPLFFSVADPVPGVTVTLYPNPATDHIALQITPGVKAVACDLFTITGRHVATTFDARSQSVSLPQLPDGTYLLRVQTGGAGVLYRRFSVRW